MIKKMQSRFIRKQGRPKKRFPTVAKPLASNSKLYADASALYKLQVWMGAIR